MSTVSDWLEAARTAAANHWATLSGWLSDPANEAEAVAKAADFDAHLRLVRCQYWTMRRTAERLAAEGKAEHAAGVQALADQALVSYAYLATGSYGSVEAAERALADVDRSCVGNPVVLLVVLGTLAAGGVAFAVAEVTHAGELMIASAHNRRRADEIAACADRGVPYAQCAAAAAPASRVEAPSRSTSAEAVRSGGSAIETLGQSAASGLGSVAWIAALAAGGYLLWRRA